MVDIFFILLIASSSLLVQEISGQAAGFQIGNGGVRWRQNCDMVGPNIATQTGPGEKCGDFCNANGGCYVFTWTNFNGGTCWMKGNNWSFKNGLQGSVCGYIPSRVADNDGRLPGGGGGGTAKGTYWNEQSDSGGCQMPQNNANYVITEALALGQSSALGNLAFRSGLCGQVLTVNCGFGAVDAVVASTCDLGDTRSDACGVDLIGKTWRKLTNNQSPGITKCSVTLSNKNPIAGNAPLCYRRPNSDTNNPYYAALGVLNTSGRVSKSATLAGVNGSRGGGDQWFQFSSGGLFTGGASVVFQFEDGSSANFRLQDCIVAGSTHIFTS